MAWIESHQELARHPKVTRLAHRLDISKPQAIGHLHLLWWWALDFAPTGSLLPFTKAELAVAAQWRGSADLFVDTLHAVGWLDDGLRVHDWPDYAGRLVLIRQLNLDRQRRYRARQRRFLLEEAAEAQPARTRKKPEPKDELLRHPEFVAAWEEWKGHLTEIGKPMSGTQERSVLTLCHREGADRSMEVIRFSVGKGARHLIWDGPPRKRKSPRASAEIALPLWRRFLASEYPGVPKGTKPSDAPNAVVQEFHQWAKSLPAK